MADRQRVYRPLFWGALFGLVWMLVVWLQDMEAESRGPWRVWVRAGEVYQEKKTDYGDGNPFRFWDAPNRSAVVRAVSGEWVQWECTDPPAWAGYRAEWKRAPFVANWRKVGP